MISNHHIKQYDVPSSGYIQPTTIDVPANYIPVNFVFRSASSLINVAQKHESAPGSFHESHSQDDAHRLVHTVTKPIVQEVREIISPFRRVTQTVEPVREEVQTIVARNAGGLGGGFGNGGGGGGVGGLGGGFGSGGGAGFRSFGGGRGEKGGSFGGGHGMSYGGSGGGGGSRYHESNSY